MLTNDNRERDHLVVSHDGNRLAYVIPTPTKNESGEIVKDVSGNDFKQIYVMNISTN